MAAAAWERGARAVTWGPPWAARPPATRRSPTHEPPDAATCGSSFTEVSSCRRDRGN